VLAPLRNGALLAGIRPEALRLADAGIPASVLHAEYLGADTVVACKVGTEAKLLARLPGRVALPDGALVHFDFDRTDLHLFDAQSGHRISQPADQREEACAH
jgi:sn-glycerol 3-phosphate transport system ATP-binding protein